MTPTFPCPACGAPNEPEAGRAQMKCAYCGANLTIPAALRRAAPPKVESTPVRAAPVPKVEAEASELLRKTQPAAIGAWNAYAAWTWIRRVLPACLIIVLIGLCACLILGASPFFLHSFGR